MAKEGHWQATIHSKGLLPVAAAAAWLAICNKPTMATKMLFFQFPC